MTDDALARSGAGWHASTRLKFRHLVLVSELARTGNVRLAAESLSMSQPAATKLLQDAESALGVQLFERSRSGVRPTPMGEVLIFRARQMLGELEAAREDMRLVALGRHGRLRLGSYIVAAQGILPIAIDGFLETYPHAQVCLQEGARDTLLPALLAGELDLVVGRVLDETSPADLQARILYEEEACIVAGARHPLVRRPSVPALALGDFPWVLPAAVTALRDRLNAVMVSHGGRSIEVQVESASLLTTIALLAQRPFLTVLPSSIAEGFEKRRELRILKVSVPRLMFPVGYYKRRSAEPSPLLRTFMDRLEDAARGRPTDQARGGVTRA